MEQSQKSSETNPEILTDEELCKVFESGEIYKHRALPFIVEAVGRLLSWKIYEEL